MFRIAVINDPRSMSDSITSVSSGKKPAADNTSDHLHVWQRSIRDMLNVLVLLGSVVVIVALSFEVFHGTMEDYRLYLKIQLWVCLVFLADFFFRFYLSRRKWRFLMHNLIFFLVAIPYLNISDYFGITQPPDVYYVIKLMPLVRGGYGLAVMVGWFTRSRITNLLISYIVILLALIYFSTLIFYSLEHGVNPHVTTYGSAVWWAFMNVMTVGANIFAVTSMGQILTVVLAASGMMMFPIFTAYITSRFQAFHKGTAGDKSKWE